jgi:hypothetical protein
VSAVRQPSVRANGAAAPFSRTFCASAALGRWWRKWIGVSSPRDRARASSRSSG